MKKPKTYTKIQNNITLNNLIKNYMIQFISGTNN